MRSKTPRKEETKSEKLTITEGNMRKRSVERVIFSRRPIVGDFMRVTKTETLFGPSLPIMAEDCVDRTTTIDVLDDEARDRIFAQLALEIPLLSDPALRSWLSHVAKKIGTEIGAPLTLTREDAPKILALIRFAVGLDDLLRALEKKDAKEIARLRALYGKKQKGKKP